MKQTKSYSLYALIIALSVHLILILLLIIFNLFTPKSAPDVEPPKEQRFKLSLKEKPAVTQEAIVKNKIPQISKARPIPRGEQLIKPALPAPKSKPALQQPTPPPAEIKKAFERHIAKPVAAIERQTLPKKEQGLYDILSKADPNARNESSKKSTSHISDSIERLYGDKFSELSPGEQKYIVDNQEVMRRITQGVLDRYGRSRIPDNIHINDTNMIEFYLHPDGSISDLHFLKNSRLSLLDETTKETIELAYAKYPRPDQKTLIRYRVWYNLTGY